MSKRLSIRFIALTLVLFGQLIVPVHAKADWPQILGPDRDGRSHDTVLTEDYSAAPPELLWEHPVGQGYAGPAICNGKVFVFHREGAEEIVEALDLVTGEPVWTRRFETTYQARIDPDTGPRCVPVCDQDNVYVFGAAGVLHCVDQSDGNVVWSRNVYGDFGGREGYFGAGSTPIVVGDHVIVNAGGRRDAGIVALSRENGDVIWQSGSDEASYSSPTVAKFGENECVVFVTRLFVVGIDPGDGGEQFRFEFGRPGPTVNAATPLVFDDKLFVSSSYGVGARLEQFDGTRHDTVWSNDSSMSSQYATAILHENHLYGTHGREDQGIADFRCIRADTGEVIWEQSSFGVAHVIAVQDELIIQTVDGECIIAAADPSGYRERYRMTLHENGGRALPALSQGIHVSRSNGDRRDGAMKAYRIGRSN